MHEAVDVAGILRCLRGHVTIGTLLWFRRIVEGSRTLTGNSAGLPIVVLVEAAEPSVMIHRYIEVNFMAARAKFSRLRAHERL
jgi:hypothetical protein